jgi:hypothetical protein
MHIVANTQAHDSRVVFQSGRVVRTIVCKTNLCYSKSRTENKKFRLVFIWCQNITNTRSVLRGTQEQTYKLRKDGCLMLGGLTKATVCYSFQSASLQTVVKNCDSSLRSPSAQQHSLIRGNDSTKAPLLRLTKPYS